jgi:hypothetical protein
VKVNNELFLANPINTMPAQLWHGRKSGQGRGKDGRGLEEKIRSGKSREEIEKDLNSHNVSYKIKDKADD